MRINRKKVRHIIVVKVMHRCVRVKWRLVFVLFFFFDFTYMQNRKYNIYKQLNLIKKQCENESQIAIKQTLLSELPSIWNEMNESQ